MNDIYALLLRQEIMITVMDMYVEYMRTMGVVYSVALLALPSLLIRYCLETSNIIK